MWLIHRLLLWDMELWPLGDFPDFAHDVAGASKHVALPTPCTLIAVGTGGIKPCVSAHVGDQFGKLNQHLSAHSIPLVLFLHQPGISDLRQILTPRLLEWYGPAVAFGLPGILMGIATLLFWMGRHKFVHIPPAGLDRFRNETLSNDGLQALKNLSPLFLLFVPMFWCLFDQTGSAWVLQAVQMDRNFLGLDWYESQVQAINPVLILILIPTFSYVIYPFVDDIVDFTPLRKICTGLVIAAVAFGLSAWIEQRIEGGTVVKSTSQYDRRAWQSINLLDGELEHNAWVSVVDPKFEKPAEAAAEPAAPAEGEDSETKKSEWLPQEHVLRLREYKSWPIEQVRFHLPSHFDEFLADAQEGAKPEFAQKLSEVDPASCLPKRITISVSDSPNPDSGWTEVGEISLQQTTEPQSIDLEPVEAKYVKLDVTENWGGPYVSLAEVEVMAGGEVPNDCSEDCSQQWPNVAAVGFQPSIGWQFLAYLLITSAEIMVSIVCLEFAYTQAPKKMKSFIMGIYFLGVSLGNVFTAAVNSFIQNPDGTSKLQGASYYWFFTYCMIGVAILCMIWSRFYKGRTYIQGEEDT